MMLKISCLGPTGTYTEEAAIARFGPKAALLLKRSFADVFASVASKESEYGLVAAENTREGIVTQTYDLLAANDLLIAGEVILSIRHALLSRSIHIDDVSVVAGHPQALAQCSEWLDANMPCCSRLAVSSNAEAARMASVDERVAAIASARAAKSYELNVLRCEIQDDPQNQTRFYVLKDGSVATDRSTNKGKAKWKVLVSLPNESGALYRALEPLYKNGISLDSLHARPSRSRNWEYLFFFDFLMNFESERSDIALKELATFADVRVLGCFPLSDG